VKSQQLKAFDTVVGTALNESWVDLSSSFIVSSTDDGNFASPTQPTVVSRKSITDVDGKSGAYWDNGASVDSSQIGLLSTWIVRHEVVLEFATPLMFGFNYTLGFVAEAGADEDATLGGKSLTLALDQEAAWFSPALHVNQVVCSTGMNYSYDSNEYSTVITQLTIHTTPTLQ
jgi:hypothetical protein